jgi:branched-chain amino acid transport system permease protein
MQVFLSQLTLGLVNGSFYAMLSLGLAVIFGLLGIVNFAHGALYMLGAYVAFIGMDKLGINYWAALIVAPIVIGALGVVDRAAVPAPPLQDRPDLRPAAHLRPGADRRRGAALLLRRLRPELRQAGAAERLDRPRLHGPADLPRLGRRRLARGLPRHLVPDRAHRARRDLRAGTENPALVQAFGINVPLMVTLTYAGGAGARRARRRARRAVIQVTPLMGSSLIIIVFAVVVIGGMGRSSARSSPAWRSASSRADQGLLSRSVEHRRLRHHGDRPDGPAGGPVRKGSVMADGQAPSRRSRIRREHGAALAARPRRPGSRARRRAVHRLYPGLHHDGALLRDLRVRLQPAARLHRAALVRPRRVLRDRGLHERLAGPLGRAAARARHRRRRRASRRCSASSSASSRSAARASTSR